MVARKGEKNVALITGEEKDRPTRMPAGIACTVEAMPLDRARPSSWPWTKSSFAPMPTAATSSPTGCYMPAAWWRPCSWGRKQSAPCCNAWCRRRRWKRGRGYHSLRFAGPEKLVRLPPTLRGRRLLGRRGLRHRRTDPPPAGRLRRGHGATIPPHPQRPGRAVSGKGSGLPGRHRRDRHGPQHGRGPRRLRPPWANSTAIAHAGWLPPRWRRSPGGPGAACGTAPSAPRLAAPRSTRNWPTPSRTTASSRWSNSPGATATSSSVISTRCSASLQAAASPAPAWSAAATPPTSRRSRHYHARTRCASMAGGPPHGPHACGTHARSPTSASWPMTATPGSAPACSATWHARAILPADWLDGQVAAVRPGRGRHRHADAAPVGRARVVLYRRPARLGAGRQRAWPSARGQWRTSSPTRCTRG